MLVNLRAEQILSKSLTDMNLLTQIENLLKIYIEFLLKYSVQFMTGFDVINIHIPMNRSNLTNSIAGPLIILLFSTRMTSTTKVFGRKSKNAAN